MFYIAAASGRSSQERTMEITPGLPTLSSLGSRDRLLPSSIVVIRQSIFRLTATLALSNLFKSSSELGYLLVLGFDDLLKSASFSAGET